MAIIHRATLSPTKLELLESWLGEQRWCTSRGRAPRLRRVGAFRYDDPGGEVGIETMLVQDRSGSPPVLYHVPLTYRGAPLAGADHALVGTTDHSTLGTRFVYDGCHDPVYVTALLAAIINGRHEATLAYAPDSDVPDGATPPADMQARGSGLVGRTRARPGEHTVALHSSTVLTSEQSNTSIICEVDLDSVPELLICKVFRVLQAGHNPDVEVQTALTRSGSAHLPAMLGSLSGTWPGGLAEPAARATNAPTAPSGGAVPVQSGDLALAQEFLAGAPDGWRQALASATADTDFTESARALGGATAEVHAQLAQQLPTAPGDPAHRASILASMRSRFAGAVAVHPALTARQSAFDATLAQAAESNWPALQRIHGDYHLGQVLDAADRGWVLIDFEGEPLRPMAERSQPDSVLRDVAGMLRSFDYAAGAVVHDGGPDRQAWAAASRQAFLEGYTAPSGLDLDLLGPLLTAFEIDKALYELVYETRHRPDWVAIPSAALDRLLPPPPTGSHPS